MELITKSFASQCLAFPSRVEQMLSTVTTVQDAKGMLDKAAAMQTYAERLKAGVEIERPIAIGVLKIKAKLGELMPAGKVGSGRGNKNPNPRLGFSDKAVSAYRKLAKNADKLDNYYESIDDVPSQAGFLKAITDTAKVDRKAKRQRDEESKASTADKSSWTVVGDQSVIECTAVITDPPYAILDEDWEPADIESFTAEWCKRWSSCGADLFCIFWSQRYLFDGRQWFDDSLEGYSFQQLLIWNYRNNKSPQSRQGFKQTWEPIFLYRLDGCDRKIQLSGSEWGDDLHDMDCHSAAVPQSNFNGADSKEHPAQKPVSVMRWLVNATTTFGELVCDPFCGSGTTGVAAVQLGRKFHGIDTSDKYRKLAKRRIGAYGTK